MILAHRLELQETRILLPRRASRDGLHAEPGRRMERAGIRPWYQMIRAIHAHHEVQKLVTFMDGLLLKLSVEFPAANSPTPRSMEIDNGWQRRGLKWKPSTLNTKIPIFIISSVIDHLPLITTILAA